MNPIGLPQAWHHARTDDDEDEYRALHGPESRLLQVKDRPRCPREDHLGVSTRTPLGAVGVDGFAPVIRAVLAR